METVAGFPFFPVEFDKDGGVVQRAQVDALLEYLKQQQASGQPVTDLLVVSHGWNTDAAGARADYNAWLACARSVLDSGQPSALTGRALVGLGVFWPSKMFGDAAVAAGGSAAPDDGSAEGLDGPTPQQALLAAQLDNLSDAMATPASTALLEQAKALLPDLEDKETARRQFADLVRHALQRDPLAGSGPASDDDATAFYSLDGAELFNRLQAPGVSDAPSAEASNKGGATDLGGDVTVDTTGEAAGIGDFVGKMLSGMQAAADNLLNLATFYLMKDRAGIVGRTGVYATLREVAAAEPAVRLHLLGHSFGGRVVTAVALGPTGGAALPIRSMTLLQAAYSQNGLGANFDSNGHDGFFRAIIAQQRVAGPIAITFTRNDHVNGIAYPLAVRVSGDDAAGLGDATDLYGAMGRNGAQHTPEATSVTMTAVGGAYSFAASGVYNVNSDAYIKSHTDVAHNEVAYLYLSAIAAGSMLSPPGSGDSRLANLDTSVLAVPLAGKIQAIRASQARGLDNDADILDVIIDVNLMYAGLTMKETGQNAMLADADSSRDRAKYQIRQLLHDILAEHNRPGLGIYERKSRLSHQYLFARLDIDSIIELIRKDNETEAIQLPDATVGPADGSPKAGSQFPMMTSRATPAHRALHRIWEDFQIQASLTQSISTVKANAAHASYGALGKDIVWAVMDSGIDGAHRHFAAYANLEPPAPLRHTDFTAMSDMPNPNTREVPVMQSSRQEEEKTALGALTDEYGHGTHVAGIIAGILPIPEKLRATAKIVLGELSEADKTVPVHAVVKHRADSGDVDYHPYEIEAISGVAPQCKLLSLKVLGKNGQGTVSNIIAAINYVQEVNGYGRRIQIHGVNLSVGYNFDPEWFACGRSPLCMEVDRLVQSGVVVVVAAGNTGYGVATAVFGGSVNMGMQVSIKDPGNAELAITVGSTHREMPHVYGVSYFSSKGPTGDGRMKPDLVAPGEKILSCAAGLSLDRIKAKLQQSQPLPGDTPMPDQCDISQETDVHFDYVEDSGTSMAAPHVSGAAAAFLSIRKEYIGQPLQVKQIFMSSATDLGRHHDFQGRGLVDLMRAIQSV